MRARSLLERLLLENLPTSKLATGPLGAQMRVERPESSSKVFSATPTRDLSFSSEKDLVADMFHAVPDKIVSVLETDLHSEPTSMTLSPTTRPH